MSDSPQPRIRGTTINLAGRDYVLPPLKLRQLRLVEDDVGRLRQYIPNPDREQREMVPVVLNREMVEKQSDRLAIMARVVFLALSRNYETVFDDEGKSVTLSEEVVMDILDMGNFNQAFEAALATSGLSPGEATAATASVSNGSTAA